jgi:hypothetical protein
MAKANQLKIIKAVLGTTGVSDTDFLARLNTIHDKMSNNPAYPTPPVDMASFKAAIDGYEKAISAALDGGKAAITSRDKFRGDVSIMFHLLGHYVEAACKSDMDTFVSSGFVAAPKRQASPPGPVAVPAIGGIDQGNTGELIVTITPVSKARMYVLRYAQAAAAGADTSWITISVATAKPPLSISGLTPTTNYVFQVRAFGKLGFSDWSTAVSRICI